jgi:hypothetical protein
MSTSTTTASPEENNTTNAGPEVVRTLRNFRSSADVVNFYRFVSDNSLRREAKQILETIYARLTKDVKKTKSRKKRKKAPKKTLH